MRRTETKRRWFLCNPGLLLAAVVVALPIGAISSLSFVAAQHSSTDLTGNWRVQTQNADGTYRRSYFNLKQEGPRITGSIRVTQFYFLIKESTGGPNGFNLVATMKDGRNERRVQYEGKLVGDELHLLTHRRVKQFSSFLAIEQNFRDVRKRFVQGLV